MISVLYFFFFGEVFCLYTCFVQLDRNLRILYFKEEKDLCYVSVCSLLFNCRFSIMAPNVFHIGVEEKVSVTVFDAGKPVTVKVYRCFDKGCPTKALKRTRQCRLVLWVERVWR